MEDLTAHVLAQAEAGHNIIVTGQCGTGKTHLMRYILLCLQNCLRRRTFFCPHVARATAMTMLAQCRSSRKQKVVLLLLVATVTVILSTQVLMTSFLVLDSKRPAVRGDTLSRERLKTKFNVTYARKQQPKILIWTPLFSNDTVWKTYLDYTMQTQCPSLCLVTYNRSELTSSDAVLFHLPDISPSPQKFDYPTYRSQDQVWVLANAESTQHIHTELSYLNSIFNWTWTYIVNSDINGIYATVFKLNDTEKLEARKSLENKSFFQDKNRNGLAMISNCRDKSGRLIILRKLQKFMKIDILGSCIPNIEVEHNISSYLFYFAFENSNCKEYVTEKFWNALGRDQIPVVAWVTSMDHIVPPKSYINVFDFDSLSDAANYILRVGNNETLYNSYFDWKRDFRVGDGPGVCQICKLLKNSTYPSQIYHRLDDWFKDDICPLGSSLLSEYWIEIRWKLTKFGLL